MEQWVQKHDAFWCVEVVLGLGSVDCFTLEFRSLSPPLRHTKFLRRIVLACVLWSRLWKE